LFVLVVPAQRRGRRNVLERGQHRVEDPIGGGTVGLRRDGRREGLHAGQPRIGLPVVKAHPNALAPGKRPFHTIIPAIVPRGAEPIAFGLVGGPNPPFAYAPFVAFRADSGMNLPAAMEAPRLTKSRATGCDAIAGLPALSHRSTIRREYTAVMGRGNAVMHNWAARRSRSADEYAR
jgi:gamma-glutamyltranspeptidase